MTFNQGFTLTPHPIVALDSYLPSESSQLEQVVAPLNAPAASLTNLWSLTAHPSVDDLVRLSQSDEVSVIVTPFDEIKQQTQKSTFNKVRDVDLASVAQTLKNAGVSLIHCDEILQILRNKKDPQAASMNADWLLEVLPEISEAKLDEAQLAAFLKFVLQSKDEKYGLYFQDGLVGIPQVTHALREMSAIGFTPDQQVQELKLLFDAYESLVDISDLTKGESDLYLGRLIEILFDTVRRGAKEDIRHKIASFNQILLGLNKFNAKFVLDLLAQFTSLLNLSPKETLAYLDLFAQVFRRWPRLGYSILDGLVSGGEKYKVKPAEFNHVLDFIAETRSFVPFLYRKYRKQPHSFIAKIKADAHKIFAGEMSHDEFMKLFSATDGRDYVLGIMQMVWPPSGMTASDRETIEDKLEDMLELGDVSEDVPASLQAKGDFDFEVPAEKYVLKDGEQNPGASLIQVWFAQDQATVSVAEKEKTLLNALQEYALAGQTEKNEKGRNVLKALCQYALTMPGYAERLAIVADDPYKTWVVLETMFTQSDSLPKLLEQAASKQDWSGFVLHGGQTIKSAKNVVTRLNAIWQDNTADVALKSRIVVSALKSFSPEEIRNKILAQPDLHPDLLPVVMALLEADPNYLTAGKLTRDICAGAMRLAIDWIRTERTRYTRESVPLQMAVRVRKGPGDALLGLTGGRCTAGNVKLRADKKYIPTAIANKTDVVNIGDICGYEILVKGKRVLALPGINPSAEFLSSVDAKIFYERMIVAAWKFAKENGFEEIYIPTDPDINSNRREIRSAIAAQGYKIKKIDRVDWIDDPADYSFDEVYVVSTQS